MAIHNVEIEVSSAGDFTYSQPRVRAERGKDQIEWRCKQGNYAVHLGDISPCDKRRYRARKGNTIRGSFRSDAPLQHYKYFVAVEVNGEIYTDDPEIIIWR